MKNKSKVEEVLGYAELILDSLKHQVSATTPAAINEIQRLEDKLDQITNLIQLEDEE